MTSEKKRKVHGVSSPCLAASSQNVLKTATAALCTALLSVTLLAGSAWADTSASVAGSSSVVPAASSGEGGSTGTTGTTTGGTTGGSTVTPTPSTPTTPVQPTVADLSKGEATITLSSASYTYDGKAKKPGVTVKVKDAVVKASGNYTVSYASNVKPGTAKVTIKAKSGSTKLKGAKTVTFKINKAQASKVFSVTLSKKSYTYNGKAKKPSVKVKAKVNGKTVTLKKGKAYTVSYKNNKAAGKASVVITGKGNYAGTTTRSFTIKKQVIKSSSAAMTKKANKYSSSTRYLILINSKAHKVGIYKGSKGNWSEVKYWSCTTGAPGTPTKKGVFSVKGKGLHFGESKGYTCWYYTQFYGNYLFHSVLYYPNSKTKIKSGILGASRWHGCVRLAKSNAKWIYDNVPRGTKVVSY